MHPGIISLYANTLGLHLTSPPNKTNMHLNTNINHIQHIRVFTIDRLSEEGEGAERRIREGRGRIRGGRERIRRGRGRIRRGRGREGVCLIKATKEKLKPDPVEFDQRLSFQETKTKKDNSS